MSLEEMLRLQKKFKKPFVTPLCFSYLSYLDMFLDDYGIRADSMAVYKVNSDLTNERLSSYLLSNKWI